MQKNCCPPIVWIQNYCWMYTNNNMFFCSQFCLSDATALSIMWQCRCWYDGTVDVMRQHCRSCNSPVIDMLALTTYQQCYSSCNSAVIGVFLRCWRDATVPSIILHRCRSCDSAIVDVTALSMWCDSAVSHATVPSFMCWHCWSDATVLSSIWQPCQSCDSPVVDVMALSTWCSVTNNEPEQHQNYISHTFKLTCIISRCTVFISMHYARPCVAWSYQLILGLLKPWLETAATDRWWTEERWEKEEFWSFFELLTHSFREPRSLPQRKRSSVKRLIPKVRF
jgi:hypothetical protein